MLIFSTQRNLQILQRATTWAMDGTFDVAPPMFSQVYSIHAKFLGRSTPLVFGILPSKRRAIYEHFLRELQNLVQGELSPGTISTDFEMSAIQASENAFPNANRRGCFFHLTKNVYRRVYENDPNFAMQCRMILALAFVPRYRCSHGFRDLDCPSTC